MKLSKFKTRLASITAASVMSLAVPVVSYGIAAGAAVTAILEIAMKIGEKVKENKDIVMLATILENTYTQITHLQESASSLMQTKEKADEALEFLRRFKQACQTTKYVYYAANNVASFYTSIADYWDYAKEEGFSNLNTSIYTVNRGLRYAKSALSDVVAIANIIEGKDENGNDVQFDAATASSKIRRLFISINRSRDAWNDLVVESGIIDPEVKNGRDVEKEFTDDGGFFNPHNISFRKAQAELQTSNFDSFLN